MPELNWTLDVDANKKRAIDILNQIQANATGAFGLPDLPADPPTVAIPTGGTMQINKFYRRMNGLGFTVQVTDTNTDAQLLEFIPSSKEHTIEFRKLVSDKVYRVLVDRKVTDITFDMFQLLSLIMDDDENRVYNSEWEPLREEYLRTNPK